MIPNIRKKQIDTLMIFNDNVTEVKENNEYLIQFESGGRPINLKILLGNQFPNERPTLQVIPALQHSWCTAAGFIEQAPGLLNYSPQNSDLGRVVQAIVREFEKHPPPFVEINVPLPSKETSPTSSGVNKITMLKEYCIPELENLTLQQIQQLNSDEQYLIDFVEELNVVKKLNDELDSNINQVDMIAKENQSRENSLNELKLRLFENVKIMKTKGENFEKLNQQFLKKSVKYSPQNIRTLLQIASSSSDSECEQYVEKFLSGDLKVEQFLNLYTEVKKQSVLRKAKEERLDHQLNALEKAGY